jgi:hypothetical protein
MKIISSVYTAARKKEKPSIYFCELSNIVKHSIETLQQRFKFTVEPVYWQQEDELQLYFLYPVF